MNLPQRGEWFTSALELALTPEFREVLKWLEVGGETRGFCPIAPRISLEFEMANFQMSITFRVSAEGFLIRALREKLKDLPNWKENDWVHLLEMMPHNSFFRTNNETAEWVWVYTG